MNQPQTNPIRYFAYVRKSTEGDEKQALSIETQKDKVRELFPQLDILEIAEERKSAFTPHIRPVFANLIERIRNGEAEGLVAWHPDRLSRNELDAATLTYMIRIGQLRDLKFGSYHFDNSPEGIMMLQMALSHSQYFSAKLSKDVLRGMAKKAEMGWYPSVAPPGYLNTPNREKGFKIVVKDPERFPLVRRIWDMMLAGNTTPPRILAVVNKKWGYRTLKRRKEGGKPLARSAIYELLTNPFYYGWFEYPEGSGRWYQGKHEPMVTREEFERVQLLLGKRGKRAPQRKVFPFTGLIRCGECGCLVTAEEKRQVICCGCKAKFSAISRTDCPRCGLDVGDMERPVLLSYVYYHCTKKKAAPCRQRSVEAGELERQIDALLARIHINRKYLGWAVKYLREAHEREKESRADVLNSQQEAYRQVCGKLDALLELRLSNELTEEEYRRKKAQLTQEKSELEALLNDTGERQAKWLELSEKTFEFACYARYWFAEGDAARKREILATLGSNLTLKDGKLSIDAAEPFSLIDKEFESRAGSARKVRT